MLALRQCRVHTGASRAVVRCMSSHEPPKKICGIPGRYASAVYTAASKANLLEKVESELLAFAKVMQANPDFTSYLTNPTIPRSIKAQTMGALVADEKAFSSITQNLLVTLAANGRLSQSSKIVSAYMELLAAKRGIISATVVTAEPLKKKNFESIQAAITALVGSSLKVDMSIKEDPSIIGGLTITLGDKFLDLSVASRINEVKRELVEADL